MTETVDITGRYEMAIKYYKLLDMLNRRGMKKSDLTKIMSQPTIAKLGKGAVIKTSVINDLCEFLDCQPGDIMEYVPELTVMEKLKKQNREIQEAPTMKEALKIPGETAKEHLREKTEDMWEE